MRQLVANGDTVLLVAGAEPHAVAVLRLRESIWTTSMEAYLAELYVVPSLRGRGIGRSLMDATINEARRRGATTVSIEVDEPDVVARHLYESLGFSNRDGRDGPFMYVYERDI